MAQATFPMDQPHRHSIFRRILHGIIKVIVLLRRVMRRHPLTAALVVIALVGAIFFMTSDEVDIPFISTPQTRFTPEGEPKSISAFLQGQINKDASVVWSGLSPDYRLDLLNQGESIDRMKMVMDSLKERGIEMHSFTYVGGKVLNNGYSAFLYLAAINTPSKQIEVPLTFTLDENADIISVVSPQLCYNKIFYTMYCAPIPNQ